MDQLEQRIKQNVAQRAQLRAGKEQLEAMLGTARRTWLSAKGHVLPTEIGIMRMIQIQRQIKKNEAQRAELRGKAYQLKANLLQVLEPSMRRDLPEPQDSKVAAKSGTTSPHSDSLDTQAEPDRVPEPSMRLA